MKLKTIPKNTVFSGHKRWSYKIGIQGEKHKECKQVDNQADDHEKEEASKYI